MWFDVSGDPKVYRKSFKRQKEIIESTGPDRTGKSIPQGLDLDLNVSVTWVKRVNPTRGSNISEREQIGTYVYKYICVRKRDREIERKTAPNRSPKFNEFLSENIPVRPQD